MAIVVIGGHSRNVGKTSAVASLIRALPEFHWTAFKVTQFGHGICSANGEPCDCETDAHLVSLSEERDPASKTDSARFLAAGALRSFWVRTRQGNLAEAMPRVRREIAKAENCIFESNSILRFLEPDLYLPLIDFATADFKDSARFMLDRADAFLVRESGLKLTPRWKHISNEFLRDKPQFVIAPPEYISPAVVDFVHSRLVSPVTRTTHC